MADIALHPAERTRRESAVRVAAREAGRRLNWPVPEALLSRIVAETVTLQRSQGDLERVAAEMVERAKNDPGAPDFRQPSEELNRYTRVIFGQVVHGFGWLSSVLAARAAAEAEGNGETSARFDELPTTNWDSPAGQARMREHAYRFGVGWMANHPELLRLGPGVIELFARTNFQRQSFERLKEVGFEARDAVSIARHAERHGVDANDIARRTAGAVESFGGGTPEGRRRWVELFRNYYANPENEQARTELDRALTEVETRGTPQQRDQVQELRPLLRLRDEARVEVQATTTVRVEARGQTDAGIDDLNGPAPGPPGPAGQAPPQPTLHAAGPR